jgi:acetyl-CoA carboxylase biotin carboxyl carrier protein
MAGINIVSPMAGSVREILVSVGDEVAEGQELVILESMKMEVPVESTGNGKVVDILVTAPVAVEEGQLLVRLGD